jgi:hypothetical protein
MRKFNVGDFVVVDNKKSTYYNELGKIVDSFYEKTAKRTIYKVHLDEGEAYLPAKDLILSLDRTVPDYDDSYDSCSGPLVFSRNNINQFIEKVQFFVTEARVNLDAIEGVIDSFREDSDFNDEQ